MNERLQAGNRGEASLVYGCCDWLNGFLRGQIVGLDPPFSVGASVWGMTANNNIRHDVCVLWSQHLEGASLIQRLVNAHVFQHEIK